MIIALGVDDTRMDLSQLEEGATTGRGLFPSTVRAPPTIAITEPLAEVEQQPPTSEAVQVGHGEGGFCLILVIVG